VSSPAGETGPSPPDDWTYPVIVLLLTIPLSAAVSDSFPLAAVAEYITGANSFGLGPYYVLAQLAFTLFMLFTFYKVGEGVDFPGQFRRFALFAFVGAVIGDLPGFYVYTSRMFFGGGEAWGGGFGYVMSIGLPEPSSLVDLLTAAALASIIPLAGLALAVFRFQLRSPAGADGDPGKSSGALWSFAATLVLVVAEFAASEYVYTLVKAPIPLFPPYDVSRQLIPGYLGFLIYPVLLLVVFYLMGRRLDLGSWGAGKFGGFALSVFVGAVAGLLVGDVLSTVIAGSSVPGLFEGYNLEVLGASLPSDGVMVVILAFAAASLGYFSRKPYAASVEGHGSTLNQGGA
jgi:hypothetical protein